MRRAESAGKGVMVVVVVVVVSSPVSPYHVVPDEKLNYQNFSTTILAATSSRTLKYHPKTYNTLAADQLEGGWRELREQPTVVH